MKSLTHPLFQFIAAHSNDSPSSLRLKYHGKTADGFSYTEAIDQIEARRKSGKKLESLTSCPLFLFPAVICAEQATASIVANFHSSLIPDSCTLLDITCGLGSDTFAFAEKAASVTAIERNSRYSEILKHNISVLEINNVTAVNADSLEWIRINDQFFDVIFADPHRRDEENRREYRLSDCMPDMTKLSPWLIRKCGFLLIKASPMLDIQEAGKEIEGTEEIFVVSLHGECKEILIKARAGASLNRITAVCLNDKESSLFSAIPQDLSQTGPLIEHDKKINEGWIYEPNPSLMKLKCWKLLCSRFESLRQLHPNTNLFFSPQLLKEFPGRIFRITDIYSSGDLKRLKGQSLNVVSRNYPEKADALHRRLRLKSGNTGFLIATTQKTGTTEETRILLRCEKEQFKKS